MNVSSIPTWFRTVLQSLHCHEKTRVSKPHQSFTKNFGRLMVSILYLFFWLIFQELNSWTWKEQNQLSTTKQISIHCSMLLIMDVKGCATSAPPIFTSLTKIGLQIATGSQITLLPSSNYCHFITENQERLFTSTTTSNVFLNYSEF